MKAWDFECVAYEGDYYCVECLPAGVDVNDDDVTPVFASDEVDVYPVCCHCGTEHTYMGLTEEGREIQARDDWERHNRGTLFETWRDTCRRHGAPEHGLYWGLGVLDELADLVGIATLVDNAEALTDLAAVRALVDIMDDSEDIEYRLRLAKKHYPTCPINWSEQREAARAELADRVREALCA